MATCWQMADELPELEARELPPELELAAAVIRKAIKDLRGVDVGLKRDAKLFFSDFRGDFSWWCEILGIAPATIQRMAGIENSALKRGYETPGNTSHKVVTAEFEGADAPALGVQLDLFPPERLKSAPAKRAGQRRNRRKKIIGLTLLAF